MNQEELQNFLSENFRGIIGALIGLIIALIFMFFGFLRGILIVIFIVLGYYAGNNWERIDVIGLLNNLLPPWR